MNDKILILDFGSQFTQLIARRIRELNVYCEIQPCTKPVTYTDALKGIILSGSPFSVNDANAPKPDITAFAAQVPVLAVCYGAQLLASQAGGEVGQSTHREYGRAHLQDISDDPFFTTIPQGSQVWMSHSDTIKRLPEGFSLIARTDSIPVAAFRSSPAYAKHPVYGIQFHPEVTHTIDGSQLLKNFIVDVCHCQQDWTPSAFIHETVARIKAQAGNSKVVMALSGGVDSTVAATLIHKAIGDNLYCIFVDNGLLRKGEFQQVLDGYKHLGLNTKGIDARHRFYGELAGVSDPETKRKIIGRLFIEVFNEEAIKLQDVSFLGQGTIYPDVIESMSVHGGPSATIKSHHNVGGLPDIMHLSLIEPLRALFKDEVRRVGRELGIDEIFIGRHPFPGPGLGIRILGPVSEEKVTMLQEADAIYIQHLRDSGAYHQVWQAGAILLPVQSVGVMGDERTYEYTCALRAVTSVDGMTADWAHLPYDLLARISNDIINRVRGINRVVYDISSKPPATIEWE
jgi:GMP synthase (glutamine-hydrolysing)